MKLQGWAVIAVFCVAWAGAVRAGDPATVYRLTHPRSCPACDVSREQLPDGIDLSGYDLSKSRLDGARARGANLQSAVLNEADLRQVDLSGANLQSAVLTQADLREANLNGARVQSVQWTGAKVAGINLSGVQLDADFSGADLAGAHFTGGQLTGARFVEAQLADTIWRAASLVQVDFARAQAPRADFTGTRMRANSFAGAHLVGATFFRLQVADLQYPIDFSGADLSGANFAEATCSGGFFRRCARTDATTTCPAGHKGPCLDFATVVAHRNRDILNRSEPCPGCDLRGINLDNKGGARVILDRADLSYASLHQFNAPHGRFVQAKFLGADLVGNFTHATFQGADLRAQRLMGTFANAQMNGADLSGAHAQLANFQGAVLINAKLVGTLLQGADFRSANLSGADVTGAIYLERTKTDATTTCPNGKPGPCW